MKCQTTWLGLYTNLNQFGEWLDQADRMVADISKDGIPLKDMKQKQKDIEKQAASKTKQFNSISNTSTDVINKCSLPLSKDIGEQVDLLKERWAALGNKIIQLRER